MLPGIPDRPDPTLSDPALSDPDGAATTAVPSVRPPVPETTRPYLPWLGVAALAVVVIGATTLWSSTLHTQSTPIESLMGTSPTAVTTEQPMTEQPTVTTVAPVATPAEQPAPPARRAVATRPVSVAPTGTTAPVATPHPPAPTAATAMSAPTNAKRGKRTATVTADPATAAVSAHTAAAH